MNNKLSLVTSAAAAPGLTLTGDAGDNTLIGGANDDKISGLAGDDTLRGLAGNDSLNGGGDDDSLYGGSGNDTLLGGDGLDNLFGGNGNDTLDGGSGPDAASYFDANAAVFVNLALTGAQNTRGAGIDTLRNIEHLGGSNFNDELTGNSLKNLLFGADGSDVLFGEGGMDGIQGSKGNDNLYGGAGKDSLEGGSGIDFYYFDTALNASTNVDKIEDWGADAGEKIQLDNAIFKKLSVGNLSAANFRASFGGHASDGNDFILYDILNHTLYYDADGSGAGAKVAFAKIGLSDEAITASDIQIF